MLYPQEERDKGLTNKNKYESTPVLKIKRKKISNLSDWMTHDEDDCEDIAKAQNNKVYHNLVSDKE